jgi:2-polyprenyl-3-methyl-5-hydroxy-6-metoxy-1,4-benzoquinol methylase
MRGEQKILDNISLTPRGLSALASEICDEGPPKMRLMQRWRPYICPFHELLQLVPVGSQQLDVGCGTGLFLSLLAVTGRIQSGAGFDPSVNAIAIARGTAEQLLRRGHTSRLKFTTASVTDAWQNEHYDVISIIDVMHHLPPNAQRMLITKAASHLRPGGLLLYKDMVRRPFWRAWANRIHDLLVARQWIRYVPIEVVEAQAREAGLEMIAAKAINVFWYGHELRTFRKPAAQISDEPQPFPKESDSSLSVPVRQ